MLFAPTAGFAALAAPPRGLGEGEPGLPAPGDGLVPGTLWLALGGALCCRTAHSLHVLPSTLALWVPARILHQVSGMGGARLRRVEVTLDEGCVGRHPSASCRVVPAGSLLPALAAAIDDDTAARRRRLVVDLVREELQGAQPLAIGIALPGAVALRAACEAVLHDGACDCSLQTMAEATGTSARTLARRFRQELHMSFSHWRLQVRLARAVLLWAEGHTLGASAAAAGYTSPSAFSFMVRRLVGMTPRRLLASRS